MPPTVRVQVTQDDIDIARAARQARDYSVCADCPVARAVARALNLEPQSHDIYVTLFAIYHIGHAYYDLPLEVKHFVIGFDRSEPVEPLTFELRRADS